MFSNVNNGIPKYSCHQFIVEQISDNLHAFLAGTVIMLIFNYGFMGGFLLVLLVKVWRACRRNKSAGSKSKSESKPAGKRDLNVE